MTRHLPPNPGQYRSLHDWARQLYEYIVGQAPIAGRVEPTPIIMSQRLDPLSARAAEDGILLFDPMACSPIVSAEGVWFPIREAPLLELEYTEAFNVNGSALAAGASKIPFGAATVTKAPWGSFNVGTNDFDLTAGDYLISGYACLAKTGGGGGSTALGYIAESSALTTVIGNVSMAPVYLHSANDMLVAPIRGQVTIATDGTYAMVVNTSDANLRLGTAHGISAFSNVYASLGISKIGLDQ